MSRFAELLIQPERLNELVSSAKCIVVDCRFELTNPDKGYEEYLSGHIPGAHFAHLDNDLASPVTAQSGRHPLPEPEQFALFLSRIGWDSSKLLVAHDGGSNALSSRLWWLMRYFGQDSALLDGGIEAWKRAGLPLVSGVVESEASAVPDLQGDTKMTVSVSDILNNTDSSSLTLIDARAPERFSGEVEPLDTRGGHIPGALNRPLGMNLDEMGQFKSPGQLRIEFEGLLQQRELETVVHSCGSGVTACHNQFAMTLAGLPQSRVYPGSWSEWIRDESRPIETGG